MNNATHRDNGNTVTLYGLCCGYVQTLGYARLIRECQGSYTVSLFSNGSLIQEHFDYLAQARRALVRIEKVGN